MQQNTSVLNKTMQKSLNADARFWRSGCPNFSFRQWCKRWYDTFPPKRTVRDKELLHQKNAESEWENFPLSLFSHPQRDLLLCWLKSGHDENEEEKEEDALRGLRKLKRYEIYSVQTTRLSLISPTVVKTRPSLVLISMTLSTTRVLGAPGSATTGTRARRGRPDAINKHFIGQILIQT